jgi:hypothetical protein
MIESRVRNSGRWIGKARIALTALACASAIYGVVDNVIRGSTAAEHFKDDEVVSEYFDAVESRERIGFVRQRFYDVVKSSTAPKRTDFPYEPEDVKEDLEKLAKAPEETVDSIDRINESLSRDVARIEEAPEVKAYHKWRNDSTITAFALAAALGIVAVLTYPYQKLMGYLGKKRSKAGGK